MSQDHDSQDYDVIVIGSGMGALAFGSIMAKMRGLRVLVLERHFKIGGFTHTFEPAGRLVLGRRAALRRRDGRRDDGRQLFDFITDGAVTWNPLPGCLRHIRLSGSEVSARTAKTISSVIIGAFPGEAASIRQYFRDLKTADNWLHRHAMAMAAPPPLSWMIRAANRMTDALPLKSSATILNTICRSPASGGSWLLNGPTTDCPPARALSLLMQ